jgi:hypothetical protein
MNGRVASARGNWVSQIFQIFSTFRTKSRHPHDQPNPQNPKTRPHVGDRGSTATERCARRRTKRRATRNHAALNLHVVRNDSKRLFLLYACVWKRHVQHTRAMAKKASDHVGKRLITRMLALMRFPSTVPARPSCRRYTFEATLRPGAALTVPLAQSDPTG